jgi:DNA-binding SARP family transcriptional activator/predicted ATPase
MLPRPPGQDIELMLLGGFNASLHGCSITGISYNKMRALLAYLAVEREQDHRREVLAELFWSGNDPVTARGNLRRTLADLRRVLELPTGKVLFSTSKDTIRFVPVAYVDATDFVRKTPIAPQNQFLAQQKDEEVVALYRGEFMAGFSLPDCPDFEDWLQVQRESLHRRALALLEQLANGYESSEDYDKALQFALRHVTLEPWDEGAHRKVMRLHALSGRDSAALGQYEACHDQLKKELGVLPSQETQHLAERIRRGEFVRRPRDTAAPQPQTLAPSPAQRRQVTVLYCALGAAAVEDPDEAMELLHAPHARCVEIIRQFSGHIVQMHGGGLLAYFGYPQAREDSARRAVQAALAVTREAAHGVEIRVGVHTGLIITGGESSIPDTVGKTSKIATELRRSVAHQEVAISKETRGLVTGYFDCISLGLQSLAGSAQPLEVFKVERESGARTRLDAASQLTPLVGRQAEIALLMDAWDQAKQGTSQVVLLQGEPGVGKSRLLHALKQRLADQPHTIRELHCFPEFSHSPFHPLLVELEAVYGFSPGDTPELKSAKLAQYLEKNHPALAQEAVPLLSALLSLPLAAEYQPSVFSAQKQKELTIALLLPMVQALAARQPVLLIVEDLHWIDPSTLEFLSRSLEKKGAGAMLAIFTARPEFVAPWKQNLMSTLAVAPLAAYDMAELVVSIYEGIAAAMVRCIVERADGIPLFAEEMVKIAALDNQARIPATLQDLLAARIDHTGEAKYTAQLAATIGREFDLDLLRKLASFSSEALAPALRALQAAGLILQGNEKSWQFKHALIQEAAYQSQAKAERQAAHRRIAQILQSDFPDVAATNPELLAQHLSSGGEIRQSIAYWIKAGQRAVQSSANLEAIAHFDSSLRFLMTLPAAQERDQTEFTILVKLCNPLHATQGYGSEETTRVIKRISALRELVGDSPEFFLAEWGRLRNTIATVGSRGVPQAAMQLLKLAHDDPVRIQAAHYVRAIATFWLGEFESSRHAGEAIALYRPDQHPRMLELFGEDLSLSYAGHLSWALYFLGFQDQAQQVCGRMLKQARAMGHPKTLAMALLFASMLHRWLNQPTQTLSLSAETIAVTREQGMLRWIATGEMLHGWALVMLEGKKGISEIKARTDYLRTAAGVNLALFLSVLAEANVHLKLYDEALGLLAQAQVDDARTGNGHFAAELHRLKGVCLLELSASNAKEAEACFEQALILSRLQGAKSLELRAAMSQARLWQQQGRKDQARHMLGEIHDWFTEGFDTPDLLEAAHLLRTLV